MKQSFVLNIWRPQGSDQAYNALTGAVVRSDTFQWVGVALPEHDYRVEYRLDPDGELQATRNKLVWSKDLYQVILHRVGQKSGLGLCTCYLPLDWVGQTFTRRVLPPEPRHTASDDDELYGEKAESIQADRLQEDKP